MQQRFRSAPQGFIFFVIRHMPQGTPLLPACISLRCDTSSLMTAAMAASFSSPWASFMAANFSFRRLSHASISAGIFWGHVFGQGFIFPMQGLAARCPRGRAEIASWPACVPDCI
jgi:hypothetical protein